MVNIDNFEKLYRDKETLVDIWIKNIDRNYNIETSETYYVGEQSLTIIRILKEEDISFYDGYTICLQNQILSNYEFSKDNIKFQTKDEFYIFFEKILSKYMYDCKPEIMNKKDFFNRVQYDYNECINEYNSRLSTSMIVRSMIDKYIQNKNIINGIQLVDLWNEVEYFIETQDSYIIYNWFTSA